MSPNQGHFPIVGGRPVRAPAHLWCALPFRTGALNPDRFFCLHALVPFPSQTPYSDGKDWKLAKKKAEKDLAVGGAFFDMIRTDTKCPADSMRTIDNFGKFQHGMLAAVNKAFSTSMTHSNRMFSSIRKE